MSWGATSLNATAPATITVQMADVEEIGFANGPGPCSVGFDSWSQNLKISRAT